MRKIIFSLLIFLSLASISIAQDYNTGIGVRGGWANGFTVKHFIQPTVAVEALVTTRWDGFLITGLYEIQKQNAFDTPRLNWYYGVGAHIGIWDTNNTLYDDGNSYTLVGVNGILGIEYCFTEIPINLGLDWKPAFNVIGSSDFWGDEIAISLRFIF